ncbi:MAG: xanthine dehydrogenase family protein subunit M [Dehalococcoidia bacterium]|nr:xanthine dehydrogenase family protein subunit M [Dehalococcoidia bacterium]
MRRFDYFRPSSLAEASTILREHGEGGLLLAGGTDVLVQVKEAGRPVRYVVSLADIEGLSGITEHASGLQIGARTRMVEVGSHPSIQARYSALSDGASLVGSVQTRHLATIGGNVCNAAPSADTSPGLAVLEATAHASGPSGERTIPIIELWTGPGRTSLEAGEVVTHFTLPAPGTRAGSHYQRHTPRKVMDIAAVGTAVYLELDASGTCTTARIALGAVAPTVIRAPRAEAALVGGPVTEETAAAAAAVAATEATPISDQRASAAFRTYLIEVMTRQSILRAAERASA